MYLMPILVARSNVKPYDVVALIALLPRTRSLFQAADAQVVVNGTLHVLLLKTEHMLDASHLIKLLKNAYHEVALETAKAAGKVMLRRSDSAPSRLADQQSSKLGRTGRKRLKLASHLRVRLSAASVAPHEAAASTSAAASQEDGALQSSTLDPSLRVMDPSEIRRLLESSLVEASKLQKHATLPLFVVGAIICTVTLVFRFVHASLAGSGHHRIEPYLIWMGASVTLTTVGTVLLLLGITPSLEETSRVRLVSTGICAYLLLRLAQGVNQWVQKGSKSCGSPPSSCDDAGESQRTALELPPEVDVALVVVAFVFMIVGVAFHGKRYTKLHHANWNVTGLVVMKSGTILLFSAYAAFAERGPAADAIFLIATGAFNIMAACCCFYPGFRARIELLVLHGVIPRHSGAVLAGFIGFGSGDRFDPATLVNQSMRSFLPKTLDAVFAQSISFNPPSQESPSPSFSTQSSHKSTSPAKTSGGRTLRRSLALRRTRTTDEVIVEQSIADYYVVHAWADNPILKVEALREVGSRFLFTNGRPASVWVDELCADPFLGPTEQLAFLPAYLARSRHLLVLMGPSMLDSMWAIAEIYLWRVIRGSWENVVIVPILAHEEDASAIIAAVDAFAVLYSSATRSEHVEGLTRAFRLATIAHVNETIRSLLPLVAEVIDRVKETSPRQLRRSSISRTSSETAFDRKVSTPVPPRPAFQRAESVPSVRGQSVVGIVMGADATGNDEMKEGVLPTGPSTTVSRRPTAGEAVRSVDPGPMLELTVETPLFVERLTELQRAGATDIGKSGVRAQRRP